MDSLATCMVNINVSNLDQAIDFYTSHLGFELTTRYDDYYAEIQAQGFRIGLHPSTELTTSRHGMSIGLGVTAFDKETSALEALGIAIRVVREGPIRLGHFTDKDGNALFLAELNN